MRPRTLLLAAALSSIGCDHSLYFRLTATEREGMAEKCDTAVRSINAVYTMFVLRTGVASTRIAGCLRLPGVPTQLAEVSEMIGTRPQISLSTGDRWEVWVVGFQDTVCPLEAARMVCGKQVFSVPTTADVQIPVDCIPEPAAQCTLPP